jgi:hypothetical protein
MLKRLCLASAASFSLLATPALAQWDDAASVQAPEPEHVSAVQQQIQSQGLNYDKASYLQAVRDRMANYGNLGEKKPTEPEKKFRLITDERGIPHVVEDTRGDAPAYQGGFGNMGQPDPKGKPQLTPLTADMLRLPKRTVDANGNPMWEADQNYFGGLKPPTKPIEIDQSALDVNGPEKGPAWAKDKIQNKRKFVEGQEHFGNEDPHGFFGE